MANADEDRIPTSEPDQPSQITSTGDDGSDVDSDSDAAPDYRFLQTTTASRKHALPSRGTKDFEPNPTARQASNLDASRLAMTDALSVVRVHASRKNENVGVYFHDPAEWDAQKFDEALILRVEDEEKRQKTREAIAAKQLEGRCVAVERFTSTYAKTMGQGDRRNWTWLLPEEALFLLERGTLDLRYDLELDDEVQQTGSSQEQKTAEVSEDDIAKLNISQVPLSLQGAYAAFVGKAGLTLERYIVYANLRRAGYIVQRAPTWNGAVDDKDSGASAPQTFATSLPAAPAAQSATYSTSLIRRLLSWLFASDTKPLTVPCFNAAMGPLIAPGLFRNYADIFRQLYLVPQYDVNSNSKETEAKDTQLDQAASQQSAANEPPLLPTFYVHKPSALAGYKKSSPPPPHYMVVVLDARTTTIPTSTQIGDLLASMPSEDVEATSKKRLETRIKNGRKNVLLAIVDSGLVSYMRFSGGGFGPGNWLWEDNERKGKISRGSKGGRGRGRGGSRGGRGRGRGS